MRSTSAKLLRQRYNDKVIKKGLTFSKAEWRKIKKFYTSIPWKQKHKFQLV